MKHSAFATSVALLCVTLFAAPEVLAQCEAPHRVVGFFNGVWNSESDALRAVQELRQINVAQRPTEEFSYELFYNATGSSHGNTGAEDIAEVFIQRSPEIGALLEQRWEVFWEVVAGDSGSSSVLGKLLDLVEVEDEQSPAAELIRKLMERVHAAQAEALARFVSDPPTDADLRRHALQVGSLLMEGHQMILVAHSQGNLFMNRAYDEAMDIATADDVKAIHIAPASPTLRGEYMLADLDLVINGLRVQGQATVPPTNINIPLSHVVENDLSGHTLIPIYLAPAIATYARYNQMFEGAMGSLALTSHDVVDDDAVGTIFSVAAAWDGPGDVDLHVIEPDGTRVYWEHPRGGVGVLDRDDERGPGPEHYVVNCEVRMDEAGRYRVEVNNYHEADGRVVTVQLATSAGGVLYSREFTLGEDLGDDVVDGLANAPAPFEILVDREPGQFGLYRVEPFPLPM